MNTTATSIASALKLLANYFGKECFTHTFTAMQIACDMVPSTIDECIAYFEQGKEFNVITDSRLLAKLEAYAAAFNLKTQTA